MLSKLRNAETACSPVRALAGNELDHVSGGGSTPASGSRIALVRTSADLGSKPGGTTDG